MNEQYTPSESPSMSSSVKHIMTAKIVATANYECTGLNAVNAHQKYKYAKLNDIYKAVKKSLANEYIDISHFRFLTNDIWILVTRLTHSPSGEWIQDVAPIENEKPGNQGHGIALTYMKKYAVLNLCAIATAEDDDALEEIKYIEEREEEYISEDKAIDLLKMVASHTESRALWSAIKGYNKINEMHELKASNYQQVKNFINSYKKSVQK